MMGSAVVSMPWAFQQSGMGLGMIISFVSFVISYYTCYLIVEMTGDDPDFADTARKYYGKILFLLFTSFLGPFGYYIGLCAPAILILGAIIVYFVIMCQMFYPIVLALYKWISGSNPAYYADPTFKHFSSSYCAMMLAVLLIYICSKKDLNIFMRIGSFGVIFIMLFVLYIIYNFIAATTNTTFEFGTTSESDLTIWSNNARTIVLFNSNFGPLAGILCAGYYLHTCSLPLIRSSANPEKKYRDLFIGYVLVFVSYAICGCLGYIGFLGFNFRDYMVGEEGGSTAGQLDQNCLNMFLYYSVPGFFLRIFIFMVVFSTYPLLVYFEMTCINLLFFRNK